MRVLAVSDWIAAATGEVSEAGERPTNRSQQGAEEETAGVGE